MANIETISEALELLKEGDNLKPVPQNHEIKETKKFQRQRKKLDLTDEDIEELKEKVKRYKPEGPLGSEIFKFRWAPDKWNMGKRGALRVIYLSVLVDKETYFMELYQKNKQETLTDEQEKEIKKLAKKIKNGEEIQ